MSNKIAKKGQSKSAINADFSTEGSTVENKSNNVFEPLYFGDTTDDGAVNVYTKQEYIEKFGEEPSVGQRLDDEQVKSWQNKETESIVEVESSKQEELFFSYGENGLDFITRDEFINLYNREPTETERVPDENNNLQEKILQEKFSSEIFESVSEEEMTFTNKNVRSILLDYCEPYVKTAYYKELFGEEKKEFTDEEIRKLSKAVNLEDLLNILDKKTLRDFAKDTGIPVSSDDERQKKLIVDGIKKLQKQENEQSVTEQNNKNYNEIIDSGIESVQANGGLSEAAIEAEMMAQESEEELFYEDFDDDYDDNYSESEYLDPQGNDTRYDELSDLENEINKILEPLYFGDTTDDGAVNVYTKQEYIEKFGEEPSVGQRLDDEQVKSWYENNNNHMITSGDTIKDEPVENSSKYLPTHDEIFDIEKDAYQEYLLTPEGKSSLASQEEAAIENENRQNEIAQAEEEFEKTGVLSKEPPKQPDPMFQKFADKHAFFVENAYVENTPIPSFGFRNAKTGHIVIMSGWEFSHTKDPKDPKESYGVTNPATDKFREKYCSQFILDKDGQKIENPDYNPYVYKNKSDIVVLQKKTENGEHIKMEIPAEQYAQMILNSCLVKDAASAEKNIEEYRQKAQLDENEQRKNNAENFTHNFTAFCRKGANNVQEAMDFAVKLLQDMRPEEREKTKAQMLSWEKQSGISYTQRLNQEYQDSVSDKPIVDKTHFAGTVLDAVRRNTEVITLEGSKLDKNCKLKVGEFINMEIAISDCLGRKKQKLPKQKMVLVSHSPDSNAVVLMDEKGLSKYVLPRDEFIKNVQKYEKKQEKNNKKENFISMSD